jgi:hypothetical protein
MWQHLATESSLIMKYLMEEEEVVRDEEQKLEQWHVFGQSLAQQQQQLAALLPKTPCAAASGAQETDQQRLFFPLDPWASSAVVDKMSRPPRQKNISTRKSSPAAAAKRGGRHL